MQYAIYQYAICRRSPSLPTERDEPKQNRRDHANRRTEGKLIGKHVGKSAANQRNPCDSGTGDPDRTAQQPSWKECAEQIK
jgi:hypothetical protein